MAPLTPALKAAVLVVVVVAFAFPFLLLSTGVLFLVAGLAVAVSIGELKAFLLDNLVARPSFVALLLGGLIGLAALARLTGALLCGKPRSANFIRLGALLGGVCLTAGLVMLRAMFATQPLTWWMFAVVLPAVATLWLIYLGRSFIFAVDA